LGAGHEDPGADLESPGNGAPNEAPGGGNGASSTTIQIDASIPDVQTNFDVFVGFDTAFPDINLPDYYVPPRDTSPPVDANQCSENGYYSATCTTCMSDTSHCCAQFEACINDLTTNGCAGYFQCVQGAGIDPQTGQAQCYGISTGTCATSTCYTYYSAGYAKWYALRTCQQSYCTGSCQ
jgi:hypothetical protein